MVKKEFILPLDDIVISLLCDNFEDPKCHITRP